MHDFEPRNLFPIEKDPKRDYPFYTLKHKSPSRLAATLGLCGDFRVFGITHPYSATHATGEYSPGYFLTESKSDAMEEAKKHWAVSTHPIIVWAIGNLIDRDMIRRRNAWAQEWNVSFWSR